MPFTATELANIAAAVLDNHMKGNHAQHVQAKPLLNDLEARSKPFAGAKEFITNQVKGDRQVTLQGYTHNDAVNYQNPTANKRVQFPWKELHAGISVTLTELKAGGISIVDTAMGKKSSMATEAEKVALVNLLDDKLEDLSEDTSHGLHQMLWRNGTQDVKEIPGIKSLILDNPAAVGAVVGGLSSETTSWWRNRANLALATGNNALANFFQTEFRQLRRYAKGPTGWRIYAGSDFLTALETELRAAGTYTDNGWDKKGGIDMAMDDVKFKNVKFRYDPMLDDLNEAGRAYVLDLKRIKLRPMANEWGKQHNPARPENVYAIYRALTYTGALEATQLNTSGVYQLA